ncbi:Clas114 [Clostera anastomosis granulovirus B]|uniref:Clas114 n=1 Tax=Clostera anastomosis granulovirus B TaxID=1986290 RepID=A0A0K0WSL6_9BBAC|nr:Clas114 [Clostera anastomosis granulovirus B]AKS25457.1 Clas114 [Clostera anastomosis granulovirus B]
MLFCIVVLLTHTVCNVIVSQTASVDAANNFPPQILSNFTYLTPELSVAPQYFSIQLHRIVDKNVAESIVYTPNVNGDRLSSKSNNTPSSTLQMFAANDGYILKNHLYNDQLCLDNYNHFKMLTRPLGLNLPNDCLLYVEMDEVYTNNTSIEYVKNVYNDVCVKSTSPGGYDDRFTFRLYTKVKSERWYVVVSKDKLSSTSVKRRASVFGVVYNLCLNKVNGNFVCLLSRKNSNCDLKKSTKIVWRNGNVELLKRLHHRPLL